MTPQQELSELLSKSSSTISVLEAPMNGRLYVVGTAHFSEESQREVADLIRLAQPNCVVLELCSSRANLLKIDEETIFRDAKSIDARKLVALIKKTSVFHGLLHYLMIKLYADLTAELKVVPGGEFRSAYNEASNIPDCKIVLGDMPVELTLKRSFGALPWYRKLKLIWIFITNNQKLTKEDIEQLKNLDLLDALMKEFGASFPEFKKVLIDERDQYLTYSLQRASQPIPNQFQPGGFIPACVVGVVGLGHIPGIKNNWNKQISIDYLIKKEAKKPPSVLRKTVSPYLKISTFIGIMAVLGYQFSKANH